MVFPLIPFCGALVALNLAGGEDFWLVTQSANPTYLSGPKETLSLFRALMLYLAVAIGQSTICVALVYTSFAAFRSEGRQARVGAVATFLVLAILLGLFFFSERARSGNALQLTYHNTCEVLLDSKVAPHLTPLPIEDEEEPTNSTAAPSPTDPAEEDDKEPKNCQQGTTSNLAYLVYIPLGLGLVASMAAAAAASRVASPLPGDREHWQDAFKKRAEDLQLGFYLTTAVLITSTAAMMQFYNLPLEIVGGEELRAGFSAYAEGMTLFWGTIFTLTLLAIYAPTALELRRQLRGQETQEDDPGAFSSWVQKLDFLSVRRRLGNAFAILAPLLVGPVGSILEVLFSTVTS